MEGQGVPPDNGKVDQRVGNQLVGEHCRADSDDEQSKLGHHPAIIYWGLKFWISRNIFSILPPEIHFLVGNILAIILFPTYTAISSTAKILAAIMLAIPTGETHMMASTILMITWRKL